MNTLLALETATDACGVALAQEGRVTAELTLRRPRQHAAQLVPLVGEALRCGGLDAADLDAVAVSAGPGSYTGLRIGASTAKGLALATGAALFGVPTLEALAAACGPVAREGDAVVATLDARRDEVYAAAFRIGADGWPEEENEAAALSVSDLPAWLEPLGEDLSGRRLWLAGPGAAKAAPPLQAGGCPGVRVLPESAAAPAAAWVARLALRRIARGAAPEDVAAFEPFYLKAYAPTPRQGSAFDRLP